MDLNLEELKVGDEIALDHKEAWTGVDTYSILRVKKITPTQVVTESFGLVRRWRKSTGMEIGRSGSGHQKLVAITAEVKQVQRRVSIARRLCKLSLEEVIKWPDEALELGWLAILEAREAETKDAK